MSENNSKTARCPRHLTSAEIRDFQQELDRLATSFDECSTMLRRSSGDPVMIPELRAAMSRGGWVLTRLLHHGAIAAPPRLPPWLSLRTKGHSRPRFRALRGRPFDGTWSPSSTVLGLVQNLRSGPEAVDTATPRRPNEDAGAAYIRRHTWIEAVAGWLGRRCMPRLQVVVVPPVYAVVDTGNPNDHSDDARIAMALDWVEDPTQQRMLFLDLGRDSVAACRHLSKELGRQIDGVTSPLQWPSTLSTFYALDDLFHDISQGSAAAAIEAHDNLFGLRGMHDEFAAIASRLDEFMKTYVGKNPTHKITNNIAVTSGCEALSRIAGRVASTANVRRSGLSRAMSSLEVARQTGDAIRIAKQEVEVGQTGELFAKAIAMAFEGWEEHRSWIRRSIEEEDVVWQTTEPKAGVAVPQAHDALRGHWVPVSQLVDENDERFTTHAKVTAFCDLHGLPSRPGLTKAGIPWPRRRDVHLESWKAKLAALDAEQEQLKDAADRLTADAKQFGKWSSEDKAK